jgi:hypothetical protein
VNENLPWDTAPMPTDAQPMPRPSRSGLKVLAVGVVGLILLLVLYVGSAGPAAALVLSQRMTMSQYRATYAPLRATESQEEIIARYRGFFVDEREWRFQTILWMNENMPDATDDGLPNP